MENKIEENTAISLTREPVLVDAIVEVLNQQVEDVKLLLERESLLLQQ